MQRLLVKLQKIVSKGKVDVAVFEKSIAKMNVNEKVAFIRKTAADVAKQKSWKKGSKLTKQNGRDVYFDSKTGNYYALDTQHGRFEVVNKKGNLLINQVDMI